MDNKEVCVALVTFNRKKLLLECLDGLMKQVKKPNAIYLIDNSSTDGTEDILLENNYISSIPPKKFQHSWKTTKEIEGIVVHYVKMENNTGGAGGFHEGMKLAHLDEYEWVWLMDDDVEPKPNALKELLEYKHISKCIHPSRESVDGKEVMWEGYIDAMTGLRVNLDNYSFNNGKDYTCVNIACFEGMLVHRDIIDKIGYPDKRFFIIYDDTVFGLLASQFTNVIMINSPLIIKKIIKTNDYSAFSAYYFVRNLFLQKTYIDNVFKKYYFSRNIFFILELFRTYAKTIRTIPLKSLSIISKATIDGLKLK